MIFKSKEKFYNFVTDRKISDKDYEYIVWKKSEMKTVKDYHNFYLECDDLLLADAFEKFRNSNLKSYELYASHYFNPPKRAKSKFKLILDANLYILCGKFKKLNLLYL